MKYKCKMLGSHAHLNDQADDLVHRRYLGGRVVVVSPPLFDDNRDAAGLVGGDFWKKCAKSHEVFEESDLSLSFAPPAAARISMAQTRLAHDAREGGQAHCRDFHRRLRPPHRRGGPLGAFPLSFGYPFSCQGRVGTRD